MLNLNLTQQEYSNKMKENKNEKSLHQRVKALHISRSTEFTF